jgi:hypothetical protein
MTNGELLDILEKESRDKKVRILFEIANEGTGELIEVLTEVSSVLPDDVVMSEEKDFITLIYGDEVKGE